MYEFGARWSVSVFTKVCLPVNRFLILAVEDAAPIDQVCVLSLDKHCLLMYRALSRSRGHVNFSIINAAGLLSEKQHGGNVWI